MNYYLVSTGWQTKIFQNMGPSEEVRKKFWEAEKWGTTIFPGNADFSAAGRGTHCL